MKRERREGGGAYHRGLKYDLELYVEGTPVTRRDAQQAARCCRLRQSLGMAGAIDYQRNGGRSSLAKLSKPREQLYLRVMLYHTRTG